MRLSQKDKSIVRRFFMNNHIAFVGCVFSILFCVADDVLWRDADSGVIKTI